MVCIVSKQGLTKKGAVQHLHEISTTTTLHQLIRDQCDLCVRQVEERKVRLTIPIPSIPHESVPAIRQHYLRQD